MAQAYTPGLKRKELCLVRKARTLPVRGQVLVKKGEKVSYSTVVARASVPGKIYVVNAALQLGIEPSGGDGDVGLGGPAEGFDLGGVGSTFKQPQSEQTRTITPVYDFERYMLKKEGEHVNKGEAIGLKKSFIGFSKRTCSAPTEGTIETISKLTGQVIIREPPVLVNINAYIPGTIINVLPDEGVIVETRAALVQGIFGIGGEVHGEIKVIGNDVLTAQQITEEYAGKVVVGGTSNLEALHRAVEVGVKGLILGSMNDKDLISFLGYDIGVAITGREETGLTLILTEGFGNLKISERTLELLKKFEGKLACINGTTQVRAGVVRPEIIVPRDYVDEDAFIELAEDTELLKGGMRPGMLVRIIRKPHFGALGRVIGLPVELQPLKTESRARVLAVELEDGTRITVPRANVEIIEEQLFK